MLAPLNGSLRAVLVGALALVIWTASPATAAPGDLDPTFDGDGRVTTDFANNTDDAFAVAIQANGKIVAAGRSDVTNGDPRFALARYHPNGTLDTTFGGDGRVTTDFGAGFDSARAVAIQGDGKIVAAGFANVTGFFDFALARYNTDGSLDSTFDGDGMVTTDFAGNHDNSFAVAIQGDGKIVAAGSATVTGRPDFALARYNTDGSLDSTFDGDGKVTTDFDGGFDGADAVAIQGDGKIVAAGSAQVLFDTDFGLARYNADGTLDTTFDGDGKVTTDIAGDRDDAFAMAIQGDGKIVAAGGANVFGPFDFALARYNTDGSLDSTFDSDGKLTTDFDGSDDDAFGVVIQRDGKIVAAGRASFTQVFALVRYNANGSLDTGFSEDGKVVTDFFGGSDQAHALAMQRDGKFVAAGCANCFAASDFALARYTGSSCRRTSRPTSIPCP
jgi:uncharacterized delta-60 repeat protein